MPAAPASAPRSSPLALTVLALLHYQPLHPYGIQRLIKQWGKDQVVNVEQRTSLYRTIERLLAALDANTAAEAGHGLPRIAMLETEYQRAVLAAEARWVAETATELRSGQLTWSPAELIAFAEGQ